LFNSAVNYRFLSEISFNEYFIHSISYGLPTYINIISTGFKAIKASFSLLVNVEISFIGHYESN